MASKGLTLISADTGEDVTGAMMGDPMRRALVQIQGVISELDKNMIVAKLAKARKRKRENGGKCEGRKPYGFREGEREVIARIVNYKWSFPRSGKHAAIARHLNLTNTPTRSGGKWTGVQVKRIIEREKGETK
jgi:DNA invertase Pin-like site-specific DNA recombinase